MNIPALSAVPPVPVQSQAAVSGRPQTAITPAPPESDLSAAARFYNYLQNLQQTDPAGLQQVTANTADRLQTAAADADANGDPVRAATLSKLAGTFQQASQTGQMPSPPNGPAGPRHVHHHGLAGHAYPAALAPDFPTLLSSVLNSGPVQS